MNALTTVSPIPSAPGAAVAVRGWERVRILGISQTSGGREAIKCVKLQKETNRTTGVSTVKGKIKTCQHEKCAASLCLYG